MEFLTQEKYFGFKKRPAPLWRGPFLGEVLLRRGALLAYVVARVI